MSKDEALKLALAALEKIGLRGWVERKEDAITAIREALAEQPAQQEPVALDDQLDDALNSLVFYRRRVEALQQWQSKMRDPERTIVCDIIANGYTLEPAGDRYKQPAQQQNPVAWVVQYAHDHKDIDFYEPDIEDLPVGTKLYTSPPASKPLTDEFLRKLHHVDQFGLFCDYDEFEQIARAIEAAHGIKGQS